MAATTPRDYGLPVPGDVVVALDQERRQSANGNLRHSSVPDGALEPRLITFRWTDCSAHAAIAVLQHYRDWRRGTFLIAMPRTDERIFVRYRSKPVVQWKPGTTAASVVAEMREALAHE